MATEENNGSTSDTEGQEPQGQQQDPTGDTSGNGDQQPPADQDKPVVTKDTKLPDDHPVVKQLKADKDKLTAARAELAEVRAQATKATQLQEELDKRPTTEALETLQNRYDRLEAFLVAAGGPIGRALDSRTFSRELFETDKDITALVKEWHRANPSATSSALASAAAGDGKPGEASPNDLIRAAWKGSKN